MNYAQISAFEAVMTSPTLTDAAAKLGRTQPAVTAAIKSLESQLGLKLFERQGRTLVPVPEAQYLLAEVSSILSQMSQVRHTIRALVDGKSGSLNVAAMPGPVSMLFPSFIAAQTKDAPGIKISMFARSSSQIAELARAQTIDFGFADLPEAHEVESFCHAQSVSGRCFVALPAAHPLASFRTISLKDLDGEPMGSLQSNHVHQHDVRMAFEANEVLFETKVESQTFLPILQFVMAGQCCALLDPLTVAHVNAARHMSDSIAIRPLVQDLRYNYVVLWPRHRPTSIVAEQLRRAWTQEVMRLLKEIGAAPEIGAPS